MIQGKVANQGSWRPAKSPTIKITAAKTAVTAAAAVPTINPFCRERVMPIPGVVRIFTSPRSTARSRTMPPPRKTGARSGHGTPVLLPPRLSSPLITTPKISPKIIPVADPQPGPRPRPAQSLNRFDLLPLNLAADQQAPAQNRNKSRQPAQQ